MAEEEHLLPRAEIFRSKLIEHFQFLDTVIDKTSEEIPRYYANEINGTLGVNIMMRTCANALVKFKLYNQKERPTYTDKRLNRIKTKNAIPVGPWAKMVVENSRVQNFMLLLIISNSIVLGIQAEISSTTSSSLQILKLFLDIFDYLALMIFIFEILLKWIDGFFEFWKNGWNIFDFFVTTVSFVPELIKAASPDDRNTGLRAFAENLRTFRILRILKVVSRFAQLRIIVLTMLKALKSLVFVLILLGAFMYIFAVTGTVMFSNHHQSTKTNILYRNIFSDLAHSLLTLFQLFTLDRWMSIMLDLRKTSSSIFSNVYIILWICVGAFIFRNVFTGIMVMNFQNIRNEFVVQCKEREQAIKDSQQRAKFEEELARQYQSHSIASRRKVTVTSGILSKYSSLLTSIYKFSQEDNKKDSLDTSHQKYMEDENTFHPLAYEDTFKMEIPDSYMHHKDSVRNETRRVSDGSQMSVKQSSLSRQFSVEGHTQGTSQPPDSLQTSNVNDVVPSGSGPPTNRSMTADKSPDGDDAVARAALRKPSQNAKLMPIGDGNTLVDESSQGRAQESGVNQVAGKRCMSVLSQKGGFRGTHDENSCLNRGSKLGSDDRSHVNQNADINEDQALDRNRKLDVNQSTFPKETALADRNLGENQAQDTSVINFGGALTESNAIKNSPGTNLEDAEGKERETGTEKQNVKEKVKEKEKESTEEKDNEKGKEKDHEKEKEKEKEREKGEENENEKEKEKEKKKGEAEDEDEDEEEEENMLSGGSDCDKLAEELDAVNDTKEYDASAYWNSTINTNLPNLKEGTNETLWPREMLFRYFQLMENLQDNLAERGQLQKLAVLALNQMHDGIVKWHPK